ncbi:MAG: PEP-CTERM sorting domain-containing protein, partial [Coleofasciculus sp. C3-bin4]|nr:PEP-CTERM sorting domain-containing protein [Coleofasciculus sp. C3-bin4]
NNSGQLAFVAGLENGISGVFRADPQPPVQSVPEPSSVLGLLAVGAFGAGSVLKRKQNGGYRIGDRLHSLP